MSDVQFYFLVTGRTTNNGFGGFANNLAAEFMVKLVKGKAPGTARIHPLRLLEQHSSSFRLHADQGGGREVSQVDRY